MSIVTAAKSGFFIVKNLVIKNLPKIAVGIGTISVIAGGVDACRQTLKASEVIEEHNEKMARLNYAVELAESGAAEYSVTEYHRDLFRVYSGTAIGFCKLYWRPVVLVGLGFTSIFGGFGVLSARHAAALGAFKAVSEQFNDYRTGVIETYGKDADKRLIGEAPDTEIVRIPKRLEDGSVEDVEMPAIPLDDVTKDTFTFLYNYKNPSWQSGGYLFNDSELERAKTVFTHELQSYGTDHIKVSKVAERLGFDKIPEYNSKMAKADFYGWMSKPGAEVKIDYTPYVEVFSADEANEQFPMIITIDVSNNDEFEWFRTKYIEDETKVGYIVKFNVDCDENGIPEEIYTKIYGDV